MNLYKKYTAKPCYFLVVDATLASDNPLQYNINRELSKIASIIIWEIDKYDYLAHEEVLPINKRQIIEQT